MNLTQSRPFNPSIAVYVYLYLFFSQIDSEILKNDLEMDSIPYLEGVVAFSILITLLHLYLDRRQLNVSGSHTVTCIYFNCNNEAWKSSYTERHGVSLVHRTLLLVFYFGQPRRPLVAPHRLPK